MLATFPRSNILVLGPNSVQSLVPSTLISQVESLLDSHRIQDAVDLADAQRRKLPANISIDSDEAEELRYVYQRTGFQCFTETRFSEAFDYFFDGELDPRLVISYYPELRGSLFTAHDSMDVFAGVAQRMPPEASVEDIIVTNLVRNYSPHLSPNVRSAQPTAELRNILLAEAKEKLDGFLRRWRNRKKTTGTGGVGSSSSAAVLGKKTLDPSMVVVDTVLVKLYAESQETQELYMLIQEPNQVVLLEVEPVLKSTGQYNALCMLYKQQGEDLKLLELWAKIIDGEWAHPEILDPLSDMISLLADKRDRALTQKWALWVMKHSPERGLKLLMPETTGKRRERPEEDLALLEEITKADPAAGMQFLEYLVLQRRSMSRQLHTRLASSYADQLCTMSMDELVSKLWRAKAASYASSPTDSSFLSYFASTTPDSPSKRLRIKTVLFLAGSSLYDPEVVRPSILQHQKVLRLELAILDGKVGDDRACLMTLVHDLHDATSAEAYCTLGGGGGAVVPPRVARALAESESYLEGWAGALFGGVGKKGAPPVPVPLGRQKEGVEEGVKKGLLKLLLEVYMMDGESSRSRAAQAMINSQAINLDLEDVISLVPPEWKLNVTSSFLARSLRRTLHAQHEGKIVKTISAGQNLEVKERTWVRIREEGMVIEEEDDGDGQDEQGREGEGQSYDEKGLALLSEKEMMVRLESRQVVKRDDVGVEKVGQRGGGDGEESDLI